MGAGNYRGSFESNGSLFSMSPSYPSESDFEAYKLAHLNDYGDPFEGDIDEYRQDLYRQEWEGLRESITEILTKRFGFLSAGASEWASFSDDFSLVMRNETCEVAIHDYNGSYLVAVAPNRGRLDLIESGGEVQAIGEFAMSHDEATANITDVAQGVADLLRSKLQESGLDLSYRTGPWTSSSFAVRSASEFKAEQDAAVTKVAAAIETLDRGPTLDYLVGDGEARRAMILAIGENSAEERQVAVATFVYDADADAILVFDASEGNRIRDVPNLPTEAVRSHLREQGLIDGLHTVPEDDVTRRYVENFAKAQVGRKEWLIPVFANEAETLFDRALVVSHEGDRIEFEHEAAVQAPVPRF